MKWNAKSPKFRPEGSVYGGDFCRLKHGVQHLMKCSSVSQTRSALAGMKGIVG